MTILMAQGGPSANGKPQYDGPASARERAPKPCPLTGHQFIRLYPDVISRADCDDLLKTFDESPFKRSGLTGRGNYTPGIKRCTEIDISKTTHPQQDALVAGAVLRALRAYAADVLSFSTIFNRCPMKDTGYLLQVYEPAPEGTEFEDGGQGFGWHVDACDPVSNARQLALILYLNDVERGGVTEFSAWGIKIRPRSGQALWFPPGFAFEHRGQTPYSGRKAIITSFINYR